MPTILHLIPTLERGGAERQMAMLAEEQARRGWSVHAGSRRGGVHERQMRDAGVVTHLLGDLRGPHPLLIGRIGRLMRRFKPDMVQTWLPQMDVAGGVVALFLSVPWVLSERASREAYEETQALMWMRRRLARFAQAVVANSIEGATYWEGVLPLESVAAVANAVDVSGIRAAAPVSCQDACESGHTLLFVGRLAPQKAPEILIRAVRDASERHDIRALMIGDGPLRGEVCASIKASGLEKRVKVLPYCADWWGLLKTCAALVSMSRFEGQPNVVLEAMAARCPLIVSDIPSHRAILDEESALIIPLEDTAALAEAIVSIVSDPETAGQRAERAAKHVDRFTIASTADAYERVYAKLLKERRA